MKGITGKKIGILLVSFVFILLYTQTGRAEGSFMTIAGFVRSVDSSAGTIGVDVVSEGCRGMKLTYKVPDNFAKDDLRASLIGQKLIFKTNSMNCQRGVIHKIVSF